MSIDEILEQMAKEEEPLPIRNCIPPSPLPWTSARSSWFPDDEPIPFTLPDNVLARSILEELSPSVEQGNHPPPAPIGLAGDAATRKASPIASGVLFYFPNALAAVAALSKIGNEQHNPGQPMHWAFDKSTDEADCIVRHLAQSGTVDTDGVRHATKVAWRALAQLERELLAAHPELEPGKNVWNFTREVDR